MSIIHYESFDLLLEPVGESTYRATVVASPGGEASVDFTLASIHAELRNVSWLSNRVRRHLKLSEVNLVETKTFDRQALGQQLFERIFASEVGRSLQHSLDAIKDDEEGVRIRLRFHKDAPELADLPWEYLYMARRNRFVVLSRHTPLVRYIPQAEPVIPLPVELPLKILVVVSNPRDVKPLNVEQEYKQLENTLAGSSVLKIERLTESNLGALLQRLQDDPVHVLHFIGHGFFNRDANVGGLIFEKEAGFSDYVQSDSLGILLSDHKPLRLVFLNACEGAVGGHVDTFAGVAQRLVQQGVPSVIAMQFPVSDQAAITLAQIFYATLVKGYPVDAALTEARKALYFQEQSSSGEWGTPVLFSRSQDNHLFNLPQDIRKLEKQERKSFEPDTILIPSGPFMMGYTSENPYFAPEWEAHQVYLTDYWVSQHLVTKEQYAVYVNDISEEMRKQLSMRPLNLSREERDYPITGVSWHDAVKYCKWLSEKTHHHYRLPTEAELEKAVQTGYDTPQNIREWTNTIWGTRFDKAEFIYPYRHDEREDPLPHRRVYRIWRRSVDNDRIPQPSLNFRGFYSPDARLDNMSFRVVLDI